MKLFIMLIIVSVIAGYAMYETHEQINGMTTEEGDTLISEGSSPTTENGTTTEGGTPTTEGASPSPAPSLRLLSIKNINEATLNHTIQNTGAYPNFTGLSAGVIPHHLTAASLIGGFFRAAHQDNDAYDTVVILGPNHEPGSDEVVTSLLDWENNVTCDTDIVSKLLNIKLADGRIAEDDGRIEDDHAVSVFVPFVARYWPGAKLAPLLISRKLSYRDTLTLADELTEIITRSGKRVLLICSIDFSHYLTPTESKLRDAETRIEIERGAYRSIHALTDANVDSPASLIIFLKYLEINGMKVRFDDNTDASAFTDVGPEGTTSYFVLSNDTPDTPGTPASPP
jgi:AmmeMemoRadiSam system protein B